jgi:thiol-disulfide isomerase/thioredoxin
MLGKLLRGILIGIAALVAVGFVFYLRNTAPVPAPIAAAEIANPTRPFVIKMHAKWCSVCMITRSMWTEVEAAYAGRANLVVFDFTTEATTAASRREAERLGLLKYFDENTGWTGPVVVLDAKSKEEAAVVSSTNFDDYRTAIDAAIASTPR